MLKKATLITGIVIVIIGILGFISNPVFGNGSFFESNTAHNILRIVIGLFVAGVAWKMEKRIEMTLKIVGIVFLVLAVLGFISTVGMDTNYLFQVFTVNNGDNWLHLIAGLAFVLASWKCCECGCEDGKCVCGKCSCLKNNTPSQVQNQTNQK